VKPANFVLTAHVAPFGHPDGVDPTRFQLFAPFESNPDRWLSMEWLDKYSDSGRAFRIGVGPSTSPALVQVKSIGDLVADHRDHPEAKSVDAEGRPCTVQTIGLLFRRPVHVDEVVYIGKEANALEPVMLRLVHDPAEVLTEYRDPGQDAWQRDVQPFLAHVPAPVLARAARRTMRMAKYYKAGAFRPSGAALRWLMPVVAGLAKRYLRRKTSSMAVRQAAERLLGSPYAQAHARGTR
jgi:hypothetical protein